MKKLIYLMMVTLTVTGAMAQAPNKMSYQTVIRNSGGSLLASQALGMRISVLKDSASGTAVFVETHAVTTNANGLASVEIGGGTAVTGTIGGIDWAAGPYFIKTETDPAGGTTYSITGTSELLSVPYALYAGSSPNTAWGLTGNSGTNTDTNFIGTTDSVGIRFRANNHAAGLIDISGSDRSTALGYKSLLSNTTGIYNTALGYQALIANTTGLSNAVVGNNALQRNTTGSLNSGVSAWIFANNTTGSSNSGIGYGAFNSNSTGSNNAAIGAWALASNRQGTNNTAIGYQADVADSNLTNATAIGAGAKVGISNALVLGNNASVGIGTSSPSAKLDVVGTIKITDGSEGAGKVLTSDANGLASWQAPASTTNIGFKATGPVGGTAASFNTNTYNNSIVLPQEVYDDGNGYNPATGIYTAPVAGLYHFEFKTEVYSASFTSGSYEFAFQVNGSSLNTKGAITSVNSNPNTNNSPQSLSTGFDLKLAAGDQFNVQVTNNSGVTINLDITEWHSFFSGYKVY